MAILGGIGGTHLLIGEGEPASDTNKGSIAGETSDGAREEDILKSLGTQFSDPCLKSSTRVLIIFSLALNKELGFGDLLSLTGTGKGSLSNHLEKLEASGYVKIKNVMTFGGPRIIAEITPKGIESYESLLASLKKLGR